MIADTVIFVLEKRKSKNNIVEVTEYESNSPEKIPQRVFQELSDYAFFYVRKEIFDVFQKIKSVKDVTQLDRIVLTTSGCGAKSTEVTDTRQNSRQIPILKGESILRYRFRRKFWFEFIDGNLSGRTRDERKLGKKFKVLLRKTGSDLIATFDDTGTYPEQSLYFVYTEEDTEKEKDNLLFILALLNSKLMNCYYRNFAVTNRDSTPQLKNIDLDKFPIKLISESQRKPIIKLVAKMLALNESLSQTEDKMTDKRAKLEDEIKQTDQTIDELVYKIYGITESEKKIIENSLK